jgi:hypothetical protein
LCNQNHNNFNIFFRNFKNWNVIGCNHVSAIISHLEHLDLQTMFQCHHYRNILVSCFFYALFNLLFTGIQAVLTEDVHLTVTMFCTSWVGTWCLIIMVFYVTRAIIAGSERLWISFRSLITVIKIPIVIYRPWLLVSDSDDCTASTTMIQTSDKRGFSIHSSSLYV